MTVEEGKRAMEKQVLIAGLNNQLRDKARELNGTDKLYVKPEGFEKDPYQKHTLRRKVSSNKKATVYDKLSYDEKGVLVWRQEERLIEGVFAANKTSAPAIRQISLSWELLGTLSKSTHGDIDLEIFQIPKESFPWLFELRDAAIAEKAAKDAKRSRLRF